MATLPEWILNKIPDSLKTLLNSEDLQIIECKSSLALPAGTNYTTDIFRTVVTYVDGKGEGKKSLSVIIKVCPDNEMLIHYDKQSRLSEQELTVYTEVLPEIHKILNEGTPLAAKCIAFVREPRSAIVLEDLSINNFQMHPRQHGIDLEHCLLTLQTLAYFHAASAVLNEKNPAMIDRYNLGIFWNNPFTLRWLEIGFDALANACAKWQGLEIYSKKLKLSKSDAIKNILTSTEISSENLRVLNHGDFWINNFMFNRTPSGKLKECRFIDFQVPLHSSPSIDLNYFWATSPNIEVRNQHLDTVLNHYYKYLTITLRNLEYPSRKIPSFEIFKEDFNKRAFYGLATTVTVLPFVTASNRSDASFEEMLNNNSDCGFQYDSYNNERYKKCVEYLLPYYDRLGVFS